ncbi:UNVERIFIED_CONTAM: hypothetical protein K2H54_059432 [Gekko kuhli]
MVLLSSCHGAFLASVLLLVWLSEAHGDCGPPKAFNNAAIRQASKQSYPVGTRLTYACISGYEPTSPTPQITECLGTEWSEVSVSCRGRRCPYPDIENGGIVGESELRLGDQITFFCNEGYRSVGRNGARCILQSNKMVWDHDPPLCENIPCLPPPEIANGNHNGQDNYVYGSAVTYRCNDPFSLIGSKTIVCRADQNMNGKWSVPAPECKEVNCRAPEVPNGVMKTSYRPSYTYQDTILFECKPGFKLKDNRGDSSCAADSSWQPPLPECVPDIHPTTSSGGDGQNNISAGSTMQSPVGSTVKPMEETTKTKIEQTEAPEPPVHEPGSSIAVPVAAGTVAAVIAVVAIAVAALKCRARHKRQGKAGVLHPEQLC